MRDLIGRVMPTLGWSAILDFLIALFLFFIVTGVVPEHLRDTGHAIATFIQAVRL
jgi:hypothetical protein